MAKSKFEFLTKTFILFILSLIAISCGTENEIISTHEHKKALPKNDSAELKNENWKLATFAGGCFWCMEPPFEKEDGVISAISGYSGGEIVDPSYQEVSSGLTKHREVVQVTFDPNKISYNELVEIFWRSIDPTDEGGQFADRGFQYSTAIFVHNDEQRAIAEASKHELGKNGPFPKPIITPILDYKNFYAAEEYHQDYYLKNPEHYKRYRKGSGREAFLEQIWN
jgi:methionine-S-sulfoxide reductase